MTSTTLTLHHGSGGCGSGSCDDFYDVNNNSDDDGGGGDMMLALLNQSTPYLPSVPHFNTFYVVYTCITDMCSFLGWTEGLKIMQIILQFCTYNMHTRTYISE